MSLFVDTSVWSLPLRRDAPVSEPRIGALRRALEGDDVVISTGIVLQELLQGFAGPRAGKEIVRRFSAPPFVTPDRQDHVDAAALRNGCRRAGVQLGTIDALLAQLCIRHRLVMFTTDADFGHAAGHCPLQLWRHEA